MEEFYRMPAFATLLVKDLDQSVDWYQRFLGFKVVFVMPAVGGNASLCHLRLSKYADLMLMEGSENAESKDIKRGIFLTFNVFEETVDFIASRLKYDNIGRFEGPFDRPWNARDLVVTDPDGHKLILTQPLAENVKIDEVIESVRSS